MQRTEAGRAAEAAALAYLEKAGLRLLHRNYRCKVGELDLVMLDGTTLVLVEVRYRSSHRYGGAAASVTPRKQQRIINAARHLLATHADLRRYPARFDVVAISALQKEIQWIKGAFEVC
ncbi:MAG: YraN family protein [Gammaproteobacteria bacterium]|nr:YraN family protein [Gammaproteobacteria bacterium]